MPDQKTFWDKQNTNLQNAGAAFGSYQTAIDAVNNLYKMALEPLADSIKGVMIGLNVDSSRLMIKPLKDGTLIDKLIVRACNHFTPTLITNRFFHISEKEVNESGFTRDEIEAAITDIIEVYKDVFIITADFDRSNETNYLIVLTIDITGFPLM